MMNNGFICESANIENLDPAFADMPIQRERKDNVTLGACCRTRSASAAPTPRSSSSGWMRDPRPRFLVGNRRCEYRGCWIVRFHGR